MMKIVFVAITVSLVGMSLTYATQAAPTQSNSCLRLKNQLLKSIVKQALIQQEDSASNKDKEMAETLTFCKLAFQLLKFLGEESLNLGNDITSEDDYCRDIEAPSEPPPVNNLASVYQMLFDILKGSGIDSMLEQYINCMLSRIG